MCFLPRPPGGKGDTAIGKNLRLLRDLGSTDVQKRSDGERDVIAKKKPMPGCGQCRGYEGKLSNDQIQELVKYIRSKR